MGIHGQGVRTTCGQRENGLNKASVHEHKLGVRYVRQVNHGETFGELEGTQRQQMEWYVRAQEAPSAKCL